MTKVPRVYIYGLSDTGKTRLVERLVLLLIQKGHRIGTVKLSKAEALDLDTEGKDTSRHIRAGSMITAATSISDAAVFVPRALDLGTLLEMMVTTGDLDLVLVEGLGDDVPETAPKIAVGDVKGRVSGTIMELPDPDGELGSLMHLLDRIMAKPDQEKVERKVELRVGGADIQLKPFVRDYLEGTVRGAVGALKDAGEPGSAIDLRIPDRKQEDKVDEPPRSLDII